MDKKIVGSPYCTLSTDIKKKVLTFDTKKHNPYSEKVNMLDFVDIKSFLCKRLLKGNKTSHTEKFLQIIYI